MTFLDLTLKYDEDIENFKWTAYLFDIDDYEKETILAKASGLYLRFFNSLNDADLVYIFDEYTQDSYNIALEFSGNRDHILSSDLFYIEKIESVVAKNNYGSDLVMRIIKAMDDCCFIAKPYNFKLKNPSEEEIQNNIVFLKEYWEKRGFEYINKELMIRDGN